MQSQTVSGEYIDEQSQRRGRQMERHQVRPTNIESGHLRQFRMNQNLASCSRCVRRDPGHSLALSIGSRSDRERSLMSLPILAVLAGRMEILIMNQPARA